MQKIAITKAFMKCRIAVVSHGTKNELFGLAYVQNLDLLMKRVPRIELFVVYTKT